MAETLLPFVQDGSLAGAVTLVATTDALLDLSCVGHANLAEQAPMRSDTLFWIASMTKPITGTAVMALVDEGLLSIDDPIEKYLPDFAGIVIETQGKLKKPDRPILLRDTLCHLSGLPFSAPSEKPTLDRLSLAQRATDYARLPLQSEPGERYLYSNAGINIAGRIIEIVTGLAYEEFLATRFFRPLGMRDTTFIPNRGQLARLATSYMADEAKTGFVETPIDQLHYPLDTPSRTPMPAGGLFSTAGDMMRFCQMIANGGAMDGKRYLSEQSIHTMTTRHTPPGEKAYGLGWALGEETYGHGGAFKTTMNIDRKTGLIVIFLVQQRGDWPNRGANAEPAFLQAAHASSL